MVSLTTIGDVVIKLIAALVSKLFGQKTHPPQPISVAHTQGSAVAIGNGNTQSVIVQQQNVYQAPPPPDSKSSSPTAIDIKRELKGIDSPYQRRAMEAHYANISVKWRVQFDSFHPLMGGREFWTFEVRGDDADSYEHVTVAANIDSNLYPRLRTLREGAWVWLEGEIKSASQPMVELQANPKVTFE